MKTFRPLLLISFSLALMNSSAVAGEYFHATITHDQETVGGTTPLLTSTGDPRPLSYGTAEFFLNNDATALSFTATVYNLDITGTQTPNDANDNLLAAHIHAAAFGVSGGVVWGFFGTPDNDGNPDNLIVTPFGAGMVGGTFSSVWNAPEGNNTTLTAQLSALLADGTYINFHTPQFRGGEIRGQIRVPDAGSTAVFLGLAMMGLLGLNRKLKQ
jgi:hypothetical protein